MCARSRRSLQLRWKRTNVPEIEAAGCVVWRHGEAGDVVLVVHRPRYDDWSFPKGKLEKGETFLEAAVREVEEETSCTGTIGAELDPVFYVDHKGRSKIVRYWLMAAAPSFDAYAFEPNDEVDVLSWMSAEEARATLSYEHDSSLLDQAAGLLRQR